MARKSTTRKYQRDERKYYVYGHTKANGDVFYVGKGSGKRLTHIARRGRYWRHVAKKHGVNPIVLAADLTEAEAFEKEIELIAYYKSIGQCQANVSLGGNGVRVPERWWGEKISNALIGIKRRKGSDSFHYKVGVVDVYNLSELYVAQRMSTHKIAGILGVSNRLILARLREFGIPIRKPGRAAIAVIHTPDGRRFESMYQAATYYGIDPESVRCSVNRVQQKGQQGRFSRA